MSVQENFGCCAALHDKLIPQLIKLIKLLKPAWAWRYHLIPLLISLIYAIMIPVCLFHSPQQYRDNGIFQISNLGNWQDGVGYFSIFMVLMALLMFVMVLKVFECRIEAFHGNERCPVHNSKDLCCHTVYYVLWHLSAFVLMMGIMMTGCFQQSYNKPTHNMGLMSMMIGFGFSATGDVHFFFKKKSSCFKRRFDLFLGYARLPLVVMLLVSGSLFWYYNDAAKKLWNDGEEDALKKLNYTECPEWNKDIMVSTDANKTVRYPTYYPCKSKTLWNENDPGWANFKTSALWEIFLFTVLIVYAWTYLCELEKSDKSCLPYFCLSECGKQPTDTDPGDTENINLLDQTGQPDATERTDEQPNEERIANTDSGTENGHLLDQTASTGQPDGTERNDEPGQLTKIIELKL